MENVNILAQVFGFIGLIFAVLSLQQKEKDKVLKFQIVANIGHALQYVVLGAFSGFCIALTSIIRSILFYHKKENKLDNLIFCINLIILAAIFTFNGMLYTLIPIIASITYTYAIWQKNMKKFRYLVILVSICWFIYNLIVGAYVGTIASLIELTSAIIAIYRFDILNKKEIGNEKCIVKK